MFDSIVFIFQKWYGKMTSEVGSVPADMQPNDIGQLSDGSSQVTKCDNTSTSPSNNNEPLNVPLADTEDFEATSSDNESKTGDQVSGRFRSRNPASRLMGSFRKLVRKTKERTSFRKSKHKNEELCDSPRNKHKTVELGKHTGSDHSKQTEIKRIDCLGSDINISDNQTYKKYGDPSDIIDVQDGSRISGDEGQDPLCERTEQPGCTVKESTSPDSQTVDSNSHGIKPHRTNANSQDLDPTEQILQTNKTEPDRTISTEHTQSKCADDNTVAIALTELQSISSDYSSPNEITSSDESPRNSITTSESNCSVKDSGHSSPTHELLEECHLEVKPTKSVIRRFTARIHDGGELIETQPSNKTPRPKKSKHKQVAFLTDEKPGVDLNSSYTLSEADSVSSFGSIPIDNESLSGSETSSGVVSFPGSVQSRDEATPTPTDVTKEGRRHSGRFDTCRRNLNHQKRARHDVTEAFRRVMPAYSIDKDSVYKVGFASRTWEVMRQGFRVALGGDSGFVCDHFLGREIAMGVMRELRAMRDGRLFDRWV